MSGDYSGVQPKRAEIDALEWPVVLEFGNDWCGLPPPNLTTLAFEAITGRES
jgi:hypothetical protein